MNTNHSLDELLNLLCEKIQFGEDLIRNMETIIGLDGSVKLQKKIRQEIEFLKKLQKTKKIKVEQLSCSNLRHLGALVDCAMRPGVVSVCKNFHISDESKLVIDIISDEGNTWTKVIARNPKSLSALSSGNASYGARSILDQAQDYLECAKLYPRLYEAPKVIFEFVSGIEETVARKLRTAGVIVKGQVLPDSKHIEDNEDSDVESNIYDAGSLQKSLKVNFDETQCIESKVHQEIIKINLDVTAMMAYISNMTNGNCHFVFKQEVLTQQAAWEAERPVKPILDELFEGKSLVCCETAWNDFEKIVNTLGGPMEKERMTVLHKRITVYPDDFAGPDDYPRQNLKVRGHIRLRSKIIFNFGHRIKALTVSANEGFVRAAKQQGVTYAAFVHESRALTEGKETSATVIPL